MPIQLTSPIIVNEVGDIFSVENVYFNFAEKSAYFNWKIKTTEGKVLSRGTQNMKEEFISFYNEGYKTHADLVKKVAELAGYPGTFQSEGLI